MLASVGCTSQKSVDDLSKQLADINARLTKLEQAETQGSRETAPKDKNKILPCAAYLQGEYGIDGYYIGVPCKLGAAGLEKIIEIKLTAEEDTALKKSAAAVKELCAVIGV